MKVTAKTWFEYISKKSKINQKAIDLMQKWLDANPDAPKNEIIMHACDIIDRYGQAAGALSCEMYETMADAQGATVETAEMAELPDTSEVGKAVNGTIKQGKRVADTVGRMVKQVGEDTTLKNAVRDDAEWAWIPHGDTCAFCIVLASRGWQSMPRGAKRELYAEHIHANCDCSFAIRFDGESTVEGYDPSVYEDMYYNASWGNTPKQKMNSIRRDLYEENKDHINAQKRAAYAARKATNDSGG